MKSKTATEQIIRMFCNSYVPSKHHLVITPIDEGKKEPKAPYCLLPRTWRDYVGTKFEPSLDKVESCKGKKCELKEALGISE